MSAEELMAQVPSPAPSKWLDDARYAELVALRDGVASLPPSTDAALRHEAEAFLYHHARLVDSHDLLGWLAGFAREAVYWIPSDRAGDPRRSVQVVFDDRRRLEDRIARMLSGVAWSETPPPPVSHAITNVEAWDHDGGRRIVATVVVSVVKSSGRHTFTGRLDDVHVEEDGAWRIRNRRIDLVDSDRHIVTAPLF
ncbi:MAG: aromatic-ring-hydroxylating dioxygenase subunit beta [Acidimicrobiales bacterium]